MYVNNLILEVTRRCNMNCAHCLRGAAQNKDMSTDIVDKILDTIDGCAIVTFTGGEPSLNIPLIRYFFQKAEEMDKMPTSFWVATNGKEHSEELALELLKAYGKMEEKDMCGVAISVDEFHEDDPKYSRLNILHGLAFYDSSKEGNFDKKYIIRSGNAIDLYPGAYRFRDSEEMPFYFDGEDAIEELCVSVDGKVTSNCDLSYDEIDRSDYDLDHMPVYAEE